MTSVDLEKVQTNLKELNEVANKIDTVINELEKGKHGRKPMGQLNSLKQQVERYQRQNNVWKSAADAGTKKKAKKLEEAQELINKSLRKIDISIEKYSPSTADGGQQPETAVVPSTQQQAATSFVTAEPTISHSPGTLEARAPGTTFKDIVMQPTQPLGTSGKGGMGCFASPTPAITPEAGLSHEDGLCLISSTESAIPNPTKQSALYHLFDVENNHVNIGHGTMKDCPDGRPNHVSFLFFSKCFLASEMKEILESLSDLARNVVRVRGIEHIDTQYKDSRRLVVDSVPTITFDEWYKHQQLEILRNFFRELFSTISSIHRGGKFFGNVRKGIRVRDQEKYSKPLFVFAALPQGRKTRKAQWDDLNELREMVDLAFEKSSDKDTFMNLCNKYLSAFDKSNMRDASFFITHPPLVYNGLDSYNLVKKIHQFKSVYPAIYNEVVKDEGDDLVIEGQWQDALSRVSKTSVPRQVYDFWIRNDPAPPKCKKTGRIFYPSERICQLHRDSFEHPRCWTLSDVAAELYYHFPYACSELYERIVIDRLHRRMNMVNFLQDEPFAMIF